MSGLWAVREEGMNLGHERNPPTTRSKSFGIAVSAHRVVQRAAPSLICLGAREQVVDELIDDPALTAAHGGGFCKIALHVYGNQRPVVRALMQLHSEQRRQVAQDISEENWGPRIIHLLVFVPFCCPIWLCCSWHCAYIHLSRCLRGKLKKIQIFLC